VDRKQQIDSERHPTAGDGNITIADSSTRGEMPFLIEFSIVRRIRLRHDAEQRTSVDQNAGIEQPECISQRRAYYQDGKKIAGNL
jgi:hypothetical protein